MTKFLLTAVLSAIVATTVFGQTYSEYNLPLKTSLRGLSVVDEQVAWASGTNGCVVKTSSGGKKWSQLIVKGYEKNDFRSIYGFDKERAIIASIGSPAYILTTADGGKSWSLVYQNNHPDVFIDGIDFWDDHNGIMYGDPINGRMFLLTTADGGKTWKEVPENKRPLLKNGEASFAASGTGIRCMDLNKVAIISGGTQSRLFLSSDQGVTWDSLKLPVIQGRSTTGAFSIAFADKHHGVITGGDFQADSLRIDHVFYTDDGIHWKAPEKPTGGYRECVEFVSRQRLIATGPGGSDISNDGGKTWKLLSQDKDFHVVRKARKGALIVMAGVGKIRTVAFP
jgi:photosystem II stability/assembly factor-like uncharacterized protein